jgi:hypothetical protein
VFDGDDNVTDNVEGADLLGQCEFPAQQLQDDGHVTTALLDETKHQVNDGEGVVMLFPAAHTIAQHKAHLHAAIAKMDRQLQQYESAQGENGSLEEDDMVKAKALVRRRRHSVLAVMPPHLGTATATVLSCRVYCRRLDNADAYSRGDPSCLLMRVDKAGEDGDVDIDVDGGGTGGSDSGGSVKLTPLSATEVVRNSCDPDWQAALTFECEPEQTLACIVYDGPPEDNDVIGRVHFKAKDVTSTASGLTLPLLRVTSDGGVGEPAGDAVFCAYPASQSYDEHRQVGAITFAFVNHYLFAVPFVPNIHPLSLSFFVTLPGCGGQHRRD